MSARTKKERQKQEQKKRRNRERRREAIREKHRSAPSAFKTEPRPEPAASVLPALPEREPTPMEDWWEHFTNAGGSEQLRMFRDKLETMQAGDEWYEYLVPEAVNELENKLSEAEHVAFLEDLWVTHPVVFAESAEWHVCSLAFFYTAQARWEDLDRVVLGYADEMAKVEEPFFVLMSLVRLTGRAQAAQRLIDATMSLNALSKLMPWAIDKLIEWAMFARYQACVQAGATDEAIDAVYRYSLDIGCEESEKRRSNQHDFALRLAGKGVPFQRDQFRKDNQETGRRVYLLTADFLRWLDMSRGFDPLVADELRRIVVETINDMERKPADLLSGLRRTDLEPVVARKLHILSLDKLRAPATILAMWHFYDFLAESGLADAKTAQTAGRVCRDLWKELRRAMNDQWQTYRFLERYVPQSEK